MGAAPSLQEETPPSDSSRAAGDGRAVAVQSERAPLLLPTPHKFHEIVAREATATCAVELHDQLCNTSAGIYLAGKRKKYWLHEKTGCNCFMLFARALGINWSEDPRYWTWFPVPVKETTPEAAAAAAGMSKPTQPTSYSESEIEVAWLLKVCWLEIHGKLELSHLTPGVNYDVVFVVMLTKHASGWSVPVTLQLGFPDGTVQKRRVDMEEKPREQWLELRAGEVKAQPGHRGDLDISLHGYEGGYWKMGLLIKGIKIAPKESSQRSDY